jgi:hypothetical protein
MATYFFHIRDDDRLIRDEEGLDLPNVAAARKEAALSAHNIVAEAIGTNDPLDYVAIEIWDDHHLVEVVHLGVLVTDVGPERKPH